jgi:hypothetical protein
VARGVGDGTGVGPAELLPQPAAARPKSPVTTRERDVLRLDMVHLQTPNLGR